MNVFPIFVEMELEPCNLFNAPYFFEISHVMIFSYTWEMKSLAYKKYVNNPFNLNKINLQQYSH